MNILVPICEQNDFELKKKYFLNAIKKDCYKIINSRQFQYFGTTQIWSGVTELPVVATAAENYRILRSSDEHAADVKLMRDVGPFFATLYILSFFLLCSGIFSILASITDQARWVVRLIKVANFFSTLLYCGIILVIVYNLNPASFRSDKKLGNIGLSWETYVYCGFV